MQIGRTRGATRVMKLVTTALFAVYVIGAVLTFWMHTAMPVTFALALVRTAVWPAWVAFQWPHGTPLGKNECTETQERNGDCG